MNRRRYLAAAGAALLAGCGSTDDGDGETGGRRSGPPTLSFGESYLTDGGIDLRCDGYESASTLEMDGESVPAPDGTTWVLVELRAENASEASLVLPWRQAVSVERGDRAFRHDVNDVPVGFLYWDGGYDGGDSVDPGVVEAGVVPIVVDADALGGPATVVYEPIQADVETAIRWTDR